MADTERQTGDKAKEQMEQQIERNRKVQMGIMHEVKTPMICVSSILREMVGKQEVDFEKLAMCQSTLDRLTNYIETTIRMINESNHYVNLEVEALDLNIFREYLYKFFGSLVGEKNITLKIEVHNEAFKWLYLPRVTILHVLSNLVTNAVKFTDPGGRIEIIFNVCRLEEYRAGLCLTVADNGSGIQSDKKTDIPGNGLGMSCVEIMVEAMRGRMAVTSQKGEGTQVMIDLEVDGSDERYERHESKEEKVNSSLASDSRTQGNKQQKLRNMKKKYAGRKVLVAEDDELFIQWVEGALGKYGIYTDKTYDGNEVVDLFKDSLIGEYQAVLMDMGLPERNGREAIRMIRQMEREDAATVPILAFTGMPIEDEETFLKQYDMTGIVPKVFEEEQLICILDMLWENMNEKQSEHTR